MPSMLDAQRSGNGGLAKLGEGVRANSDVKTQAGLSRGPNQSKKLVNAPWTDTFPAQGATLDLDFVNNRSFVRGVGQGRVMNTITFTRASSATFVGSNGLLQGGFTDRGALGNNLFNSPQDFESLWGKNESLVNAKASIAPDQTLTATKLFVLPGTNSTSHFLRSQNVTTTANIHTYSIYAKASEFRYIGLRYINILSSISTTKSFDLVAGVEISQIESDNGKTSTATITPAGNDWYRCTITLTPEATTTSEFQLRLYNNLSQANYTGDAHLGAGVLIWGAQLEVGSISTEYFPTNVNEPRFDWASTAVLPIKNLATNTENIFNLSNTIIISDATVSPDGLTTADKIIPTAVTGSHWAENGLAGGYVILNDGIYTISCYAKKEEYIGFRIVLRNSDARYAAYTFNVNTNTGVYVGVSAFSTVPTLVSTSVDDVGNGWYRCRVTINNSSTAFAYRVVLSVTSAATIPIGAYAGDGTSGLYVWGTQVERGDTLTSYQAVAQPTTNTPLLANPTSNGLLIEEARTNRILWCRDATKIGTNLVNYSEQFDNAFWVKTGLLAFGSGSVANTTATTDPLGGNTADLIVENGNNDFHTMSSTSGFPVAAIGGVYVASIYVKRPTVNGRRYFQITFSQGAFQNVQYATFDLQDGVVSGSAATVGTPVMTDVGDGWYRCSVAATATATASSLVFFIFTNAPTGRSPSYQGDGTSGVYIWGAQIEETFLGNYVATTTAPIIGWRNINVTVAKNQTGIDGVANACSSITATSANGSCVQTINLVSGLRTASVYLKRITGTGTIQVTLDGTTYSTVDLSTSEWRRIVLSGTVTNPTVGIRIVTSGDAVAIDFAQVEDGGFVTSPIMTTNATAGVTRASDLGTISGAIFNGFYNRINGTLISNSVNYPIASITRSSVNQSWLNSPAGITYAGGVTYFGVSFITNNTQSLNFGMYKGGGTDESVAYGQNILPVSINPKVAASFSINGTFKLGISGKYNAINPGDPSGRTSETVINDATALSLTSFLGTPSFGTFNGAIAQLIYIPKFITENALLELTK